MLWYVSSYENSLMDRSDICGNKKEIIVKGWFLWMGKVAL